MVFTGGRSLYEAKKSRHGNIHAFPSSIDKPVISTAIQDVVDPYGEQSLVRIAGNADAFIEAAEREFASPDRMSWLRKVNVFFGEQLLGCDMAPDGRAEQAMPARAPVQENGKLILSNYTAYGERRTACLIM